MDKYLASKIVNQYVDSIEDDATAFKKLSSLMYSKDKIEEAFFAFLEEYIILFRNLGEDFGAELIGWYCMMDLFIADSEADRLNGHLESGLLVVEKGEPVKGMPVLARMLRLAKGVQDGLLNNHSKISRIRHALIKYAIDSRNGIYFDEINEHFGRCSDKHITKEMLSLSIDQRVEEALKRVKSELAVNNNEWWKIKRHRTVEAKANKEAAPIQSKAVTEAIACKLILKFAGASE